MPIWSLPADVGQTVTSAITLAITEKARLTIIMSCGQEQKYSLEIPTTFAFEACSHYKTGT